MALFGNKTEQKKETIEEVATSVATSDVPSMPAVKTTAGFKAVLLKPRVSEKAARFAEAGKYVFEVTGKANKIEVKKAIEQSYKVHVTQVNMIRNQGKIKNFGNRAGRTSDFKKAIVTLREGEKIEGATETI